MLTAQIDEATLEAMIARATKTEFMESTTRKSALHPDDLARALTMKVRAVGFIPSINLDEQTIVTRFGEPAERVRGSDGVEHLLYPAKGLDIILSTTGKELMQYVAPVNFETLRTPLDAAASAPPVAPDPEPYPARTRALLACPIAAALAASP